MVRRFSNSILLHQLLSLFLLTATTCFTLGFTTTTTTTTSSSSRMTSSSSTSSSSTTMSAIPSASGKDLLYQDQQLAMERRANEEELLLNSSTTNKSKSKSNELMSPKIKPKPPKSGKGFGSTGSSDSDNDTIENRIAIEQCKILQRDGVIKISNVLSNDMADELREYVLQQQTIASNVVDKAASENDALKVSKSFYGVENSRTSRCDLQLSLLKGGYLSDGNNNGENDGSSSNNDQQQQNQQHTIADTLNALLGSGSSSNSNGNGGKGEGNSKKTSTSTGSGVGTLRHIYENLVTRNGEFYELAAVITNPGSKRQQIHPDLPYQDKHGAPLYVVFLALQVSKN
jgi:hypothetical protein